MPFESETLAVEIRGSGASLTVFILRRTNPQATDFWDYNFVSVRVEAEVSGFRARFEELLDLGELRHFRESITRLYRELQGEATLEAVDDFLEVTAQAGARGTVDWNILLQYPGGTGAQLRFEMENDQSYLPALLRQIDAVFAAYPLEQS